MKKHILTCMLVFTSYFAFSQNITSSILEAHTKQFNIGDSLQVISSKDSLQLTKLRAQVKVSENTSTFVKFDKSERQLSKMVFEGPDYLEKNSKMMAWSLKKYFKDSTINKIEIQINYTQNKGSLGISDVDEYPVHRKCLKFSSRSENGLDCLKKNIRKELVKSLPQDLPIENKTKTTLRFVIMSDKQIESPVYVGGNEDYARYLMMSSINMIPVIRAAKKEKEWVSTILELDFEHKKIVQKKSKKIKKKKKKKEKKYW